MNVIRCELEGLLIIEPKVFGDARGFFMETWHEARYREAGIGDRFVQDNLSLSRRGILRGLHFQNPRPQGKLVSVIQGEVFDVAIDLRRASATFGKCQSTVLSAENKRQFYVPPGFGHGFLVLSETALFQYKCTDFYMPQHEMTLRWNDPALAIKWPISSPSLSEKDARGLLLKDLPAARLF